ncbi:uncharacterized protein METZ01_LOCUS257462, partial [marine metagenome]
NAARPHPASRLPARHSASVAASRWPNAFR